jgi:hypothetical protein
MVLKINQKPRKTNSSDLYYVVFHTDKFDYKKPPLPKKRIEYQSGVERPIYWSLRDYRYLIGQDANYSNRLEETLFINLEEKDLTYLGLILNVVEVYTVTFNSIESRELSLSTGKLVDALKVYDGLSSRQRKIAIKKDPIYETVYLTDVQKELFRAKGYMLKSVFDKEYIKLVDSAILNPHEIANKKLINWHLKILGPLYKLRF